MTTPTLAQLAEEECPCKTRRTPPCAEREPLSRCGNCVLRPRILALVERVRRETVEEERTKWLTLPIGSLAIFHRDTAHDKADCKTCEKVLALVDPIIRALAEKGNE